jgi:enoyl-[acyl-carrier protein] reductase/trans-2-enoyl-CoA reductase (NAD+)
MIIAPKMRGFICTTAHPAGCAENVRQQIEYAKKTKLENGPKRVLVVGSSTGYGLAARIAAAFSCGADTLGVFYEKPAAKGRTATAGWYNSLAFERKAKEAGLIAESINGDAFSNVVKQEAITLMKEKLGGKIDLIIYSLAAPKRQDPDTGEVYSSVIKPLGRPFTGKTVDFHTGEVSQVTIGPASEEEAAETVKVMGGEDWLLWMNALSDAGVLAENAMTAAFSYIGPELTHAVYKDGTIGRAKEDLEQKAKDISAMLSPIGGRAFVSVNKALVTQASAAIPVVPLYMSILFKLMKEAGTHEDCIGQMVRMFSDMLYSGSDVPLDEHGRIRLDDLEMKPEIQAAVDRLWQRVETANAEELTDLKGYREDFLRLFGFGLENVDYNADIEP